MTTAKLMDLGKFLLAPILKIFMKLEVLRMGN